MFMWWGGGTYLEMSYVRQSYTVVQLDTNTLGLDKLQAVQN